MRYDLGRRPNAVCASPQRPPASAGGTTTVRERCSSMTLVPRGVSHRNRDCRTDVQRPSQDPARLASPGSTCQPLRSGSATVVCFPAFASEFPIWVRFCYLTLTWALHRVEGFLKERCIIQGVCASANGYPNDFEIWSIQ
jgi:hypothetical protein